jgi:hypothetical protein
MVVINPPSQMTHTRIALVASNHQFRTAGSKPSAAAENHRHGINRPSRNDPPIASWAT